MPKPPQIDEAIILKAIEMTDSELVRKIAEGQPGGYGMSGKEPNTKSFIMANIIAIRKAICGTVEEPVDLEAVGNVVNHVKDIATVLTVVFPPAIVIYVAAAVYRYGVKNVCC